MPVKHRGDREQQVRDLHRKRPDLTAVQIAQELQCCVSYTRFIARKLSLVLPRDVSQGRVLQEWERQAILDAYRDGEKTVAVAFEFGVSVSCVTKIGRRAGCEPRVLGGGRWPAGTTSTRSASAANMENVDA